MNPYRAVQAVLRVESNRAVGVLGSCFRLRSGRRFITAAHCVESRSPSDVAVMNPVDEKQNFLCEQISRHPSADLAILEIGNDAPDKFEILRHRDYGKALTLPVNCFGFVADSSRGFSHVTPRVIGGLIQRDLVYSDGKYRSEALELSVPIPRGVSGGPAFASSDPEGVLGVAIASIKSEVTVHSFTEVRGGGEVYKEKTVEVVRYGVILRLESMMAWVRDELTKGG